VAEARAGVAMSDSEEVTAGLGKNPLTGIAY